VFFGVEIIVREFVVDALFTVMLSAMIADVTAIPFLGDKPFLSGFPRRHRSGSAAPAASSPRRCSSASPAGWPTGPEAIAGPVTGRHDPQALFGSESLGQALRHLEVYGRDGLPVLSPDGHLAAGQHPRLATARPTAPRASSGQRPCPRRLRQPASREGSST
jgi:hypothetical protein